MSAAQVATGSVTAPVQASVSAPVTTAAPMTSYAAPTTSYAAPMMGSTCAGGACVFVPCCSKQEHFGIM